MSESLTFKELTDRTHRLIERFEKVEQKKWGVEGNMIELMKQVGDLAKNVMTYEGYYFKERDDNPNYGISKEKLADEIADLLFMAMRLARQYNIDLEAEHLKMLDSANNYLDTKVSGAN